MSTAIFSRGSLVPADLTFHQFKDFAYRVLDKFRREEGIDYHYHGNRHSFAHRSWVRKWADRTQELIGIQLQIECPVVEQKFGKDYSEMVADRTGLSVEEVERIDKDIRLQIMEELGHGRISISYSYLGGSKKIPDASRERSAQSLPFC